MKKRRMRVFHRYLVSHCGIALLSCALIGVFLFNYFVQAYGTRMYQSEVERTRAVLSDLDAQWDSMQRISYGVTQDINYSFAELRADNYKEYLMLKEFVRYSVRTMLTKRYFLFFQGTDRVYYSSNQKDDGVGSTYNADLFLSDVLGCSEPTALYATLTNMKRRSVFPLDGTNLILFCFPITIRSSSTNAVLCFCVKKSELLERVKLVSGIHDDFTLSFNDTILYQADMAADGTRLVQEISPVVGFTIARYVEVNLYMRDLNFYRKILIFLTLFCVILLSVTAWIARQHSKPIRRISALVQSDASTESMSELETIELNLRNMLNQDAEYKRQLNAQMRLLREQALRLLLCGEYGDTLRDTLARMNLSFENRYVATMVAHILHKNDTTDETLTQQIEDLSGEEMTYLCCADTLRGDIDIVLSCGWNDEKTLADAAEMIQDLLDALGVSAKLGKGSLYDTPSKLAASYAEARDNLLEGTGIEMPLSETRHCFERIIGVVRMGEQDEALRLLEAFVREQGENVSFMRQRYIFIDLLNMLISVAQEIGIADPSRQISVVMTGKNISEIVEGMRGLIVAICERMARTEESDEKLIHKIIKYIRSHCLENDLSLERISGEFHITSCYLSRLVCMSVGCGYKDYVLRLRMEHACELLRNGVSATDTCRECGYVNLSHFIKTFKQFTGQTPSSYQRSFQEDMKA